MVILSNAIVFINFSIYNPCEVEIFDFNTFDILNFINFKEERFDEYIENIKH